MPQAKTKGKPLKSFWLSSAAALVSSETKQNKDSSCYPNNKCKCFIKCAIYKEKYYVIMYNKMHKAENAEKSEAILFPRLHLQ